MATQNEDAIAKQDNLVVFRNGSEAEMHAHLLRLGRHAATFEVYNPEVVLRTSEMLRGFKIFSKDRTLYSGRAVVSNLVNAGTTVVCEAKLDDISFDPDFLSSISPLGRLSARFDEFAQDWQKICRVDPKFKLALIDIQTFLMDLRHWSEQIELGLCSSLLADKTQRENEAIEAVSKPVVFTLNHLFARFEEVASRLDSELQPLYRSYAQRLLHPVVLCAPFANRTFQKPLGYAGDYEMVNMMLRDPKEGASFFAKLFNLWLLQQDSAAAHRNRVQFLSQCLTRELLRCLRLRRPLQVITLGCGPAYEVQRFIAQGSLADHAQFTLLDFNDETINYTRRVIDEIRRQNWRQTSVNVIRRSVHDVLKQAAKSVNGKANCSYDLVCCSGLFDYLSDRTCKQLMEIFWNWTRPGGLVLATNVTPRSPNRGSLELLLDWHLIYRDAQRFAALAPRGAPPDCVRMYTEDTGVNIFMEARKPDA